MNYGDAIQKLFANFLADYLNSSGFADEAQDIYNDYILSDAKEKIVRGILSQQELDDTDRKVLQVMLRNDDCDTQEPDDMVQEYADNLINYLYTYKPEATAIDPNIDPEEEHRGPMAQDIEKVAPDCIKETPEGIKKVDGNRLALVNAGVIGDLARRLIQLEDEVHATSR